MKVGTFIKTPAPHVAEILGLSGLDFAVIDAEHGPFDRLAADMMMIGGKASGLPLFVRVAALDATSILWALDIGSAGLIIPHVDSADDAHVAVALARFQGGTRGFSNSGRFGNYGVRTMPEAIEHGDRAQIFCQIESSAAVVAADAIAAVPGVAGLVIGRADLALSLGEQSPNAPTVLEGTRHALAAATAAGKLGVIVVGHARELPQFVTMGAKMAIIGSDQSFLRHGADAAKEAAEAAWVEQEQEPQ